jgi:hypothetical protein
MTCFHLSSQRLSLLRRNPTRLGLAAHHSDQADVRAVPSLGVLGTRAARLTALDGALRHRTAAHGHRV